MKTHIEYATQKLLADPEVKLIATVNHRDNFHLWAASRVFGWMTDSMDVINRDNNALQFNALCEECNRKEHDVQYRYSPHNDTTHKLEREWNNHTPTKSPTIRAICDGVYDKFNA